MSRTFRSRRAFVEYETNRNRSKFFRELHGACDLRCLTSLPSYALLVVSPWEWINSRDNSRLCDNFRVTPDRPSFEPEIGRKTIEQSMHRTVLEGVQSLAFGLGFLFIALCIFEFNGLPPSVRVKVALSDAVLIPTFFGIYTATVSGKIPLGQANAWGTILSWLAGINILFAAALLKIDLLYTAYLGLAFLGAATVLLSVRWMVLAVLAPIGPWAAVMLPFTSSKDFGNDCFVLLSAIMVSFVLFFTRRRAFFRLQRLREFTSALLGHRATKEVGKVLGQFAALLTDAPAWALQWNPDTRREEWFFDYGRPLERTNVMTTFSRLDDSQRTALAQGHPIIYSLGKKQTILGIPLRTKRDLVGVAWLAKRHFKRFVVAHRELAETCADQVSIAFESIRLLDEVEHLATTDELTGVFNRRQFFFLAQRELARRNQPARGYVSAVMADIDHFKGINDKYGHGAGDIVLKEVARRLQTGIRISDILGRYGGEEFALILTETTPSSAQHVVERLRVAMASEPVSVQTHQLDVTVSFGVAICTNHSQTLEEVLARADAALYHAKDAGRNRVVLDAE